MYEYQLVKTSLDKQYLVIFLVSKMSSDEEVAICMRYNLHNLEEREKKSYVYTH